MADYSDPCTIVIRHEWLLSKSITNVLAHLSTKEPENTQSSAIVVKQLGDIARDATRRLVPAGI